MALAMLTGGYLWATDAAHLLYIASILLHAPLGLAMVGALAWGWRHAEAPARRTARTMLLILVGSGLLFGYLGAEGPGWVALLHGWIGFAAGAGVLWLLRNQWAKLPRAYGFAGVALAGALLLPLVFALLPASGTRITNPVLAPATMADAAMGGAEGPFFPSPAATAHGGLIDADFFLDSESCGRTGCHPDVTAQWNRSAHHFASFNNQWYRKSIEYMQEVVGTQAPQWCAGCHDHALLFSGQMNQPVADFLDHPASQAGIGCLSCHSVSNVDGTIGNGGLTVTVPPMHDLATSEEPLLRALHDFTLHLDPAPHRETFFRRFLTEQPAEFCASCHKVHLDAPVNHYRWVRGFNTYDNWQASGVSGEGARSFYAPPSPQTCVTCHMPPVPSDDAGNDDGFVRSHAFLAANTALPTANRDSLQHAQTEAFLRAGQITLDLFAVSLPEAAPAEAATQPSPAPTEALTTFAVGDEQGLTVGRGGRTRTAVPVFGALDGGEAVLVPGTSARVELVVRTRGLGHFFPTGTVDAQEAWVAFQAVDAAGRVLHTTGAVDAAGRVDPSAHFYRNLLVDAHANPIDKRNAWASRATVYVNLIPPGAADIVHLRLAVPPDATGPITLTAQLHYRKFTDAYTRFSYAGQMDSTGSFTPDYDDRGWHAGPVPADVSGPMKTLPDLPIVTMATDTLVLRLAPADARPTPTPNASDDALRWNDYGIGLLREGDLKSAERAFQRVTTLAPDYADGWVNRARVYLQESDLARADTVLAEALRVQPGFPKARYFRALLHKARGDYAPALADLRAVADAFPRDRVVLNDLGRVLFLDEQLEAAIAPLEAVLQIDPEDLTAHYNLMLTHQALGHTDRADAHRQRYERYKDDETTPALARQYRQRDPHANREALPIHEH